MSGDAPLVPGPLYGLRTWTLVGAHGAERLSGPRRGGTWPTGGAWLDASCELHPAPGPDCHCGIHAFHPSPRSAARVLALRRQVPGIVAGGGAIEVHEDGFRAERARPHALVLTRGRNPALTRRLAAAYDVPVVELDGAGDLANWCRERGLGLDDGVVAELLGPAELAARRRAQRRRGRRDALRLVAAMALIALLALAGSLATEPPFERTLFGRTGEVRQQR